MMRMTSALVFVCASFLVGCAWGDGSGDDGAGGGGGVDAAVASAVCGDSVCAASEVGNCSSDCGSGTTNPVCGNSTCETGETSTSCPNDCGGGGATCGNGTCDSASGETMATCPNDCTGGGSGAACPADPTACLFCSILGQMCPAGHDMNSCAACAGGLPI